MLRMRAIVRVLAVIVALVMSTAVAHAGGGQGGGGTSIEGKQCYVIARTVNQPHVVTLDDQFGTRQHVRVGNAVLVCTPVTVTLESGSPSPDGGFDNVAGDGEHHTCYSITPLVRGPNTTVEISDQIDTETVKVLSPALLCTFSNKTIVE
jgi:hypothetical protein